MPNIKLDWSGASSTAPIAGYEIEYKLSTGSTFIPLTTVTTSATSGTYTWTGAIYNATYNFRIRTKDNVNNYSAYKTVNITTIPTTNQPPTPFDYYSSTNFSRQIDFFFAGATDDYGIKGYEISYKKVSDSTYTVLPFITTANAFLEYSLTDLEVNTEYNVRARTQDMFGVWSTAYYEILVNTTPAFQYLRSNDYQTDFDLDICAVNQPSVHCYFNKPIGEVVVGDILYHNNTLTAVFDGDSHWWRIGSINTANPKSYRINDLGVIEFIEECPNYVQEFKRSSTSLTPPSLPNNETSDGCVNLLLTSNLNLYSNKELFDLEAGDRLYTNNTLTTGFNGGGNIWLIGTILLGTVSAKITTGGYITEIYQC
jgi:hypothetical protein